MADYSGTISADVTLHTGDTLFSTNNCIISTGYTIDADAGAIIDCYNGKYLLGNSGSVIFVGTAANPITFRSISADPGYQAWDSIRGMGILTLTYVKLYNCRYNLYLSYSTATNTISKIWYEDGDQGLYCVLAAGQTVSISGLYSRRIQTFNVDANHAASQSITVDKVWSDDSYGNGYTNDGIVFNISNYVSRGLNSSYNPIRAEDKSISTYTNAWLESATYGAYVQHADTTTTITESVVTSSGRPLYANGADVTLASSYNDIIEGLYEGAIAAGGSVITSDYDAFVGNARRPKGLFDVSTGTQYSALTSHTNAMSTLNKPLEVDNISEGTPDASSITITYDCAAGTTGKRNKALPYIKYGTVSGTYNMRTYLPPEDQWGLYWIEWYTDFTWKSTGHSVTLSNLKAGTKYYYKCCWVDPLGRIAESAEGDFTTTSAGGGTTIGLIG